MAEPQRVAATTTVHSPATSGAEDASSSSVRKYLGNRSPSGQSPVTKSRKTPHNANLAISGGAAGGGQSSASGKDAEKDIGSPKSRTWKGLVARQFRKIQGNPSSPASNYVVLPEGASVGVPLALCPMVSEVVWSILFKLLNNYYLSCLQSDENEFVPLLIMRCTDIVEHKGLTVVGIYRIPGNTAAITALTEQVNRGFDDQTLNDPKWDDVNVVSSLLKLFIRSLPDGLLPTDMYQHFIDADKDSGQAR